VLQAEDDLDAHEWMEAIQGVTACLLNGNVDIEALSKAQPKPSKPTHSRQGSRAGKSTWCVMHSHFAVSFRFPVGHTGQPEGMRVLSLQVNKQTAGSCFLWPLAA